TDTPGGAVLALTSDHTVHNLPYGATKGALDRMVLAGTHELADRGIRTNVINPGPIDTGWMDDGVREACAAQTDRKSVAEGTGAQSCALPICTDTPGGAVLALTSDHTVHNLPSGATKGALDRMVLAGTHELADRGIRTNVINPGPIDTGWMDDEVREACAAQ